MEFIVCPFVSRIEHLHCEKSAINDIYFWLSWSSLNSYIKQTSS